MEEPLFDAYHRFEREPLEALGLPRAHVAFLSDVGLPMWCAPNICFGEVYERGEHLPLITEGGARYVGIGEDRDDNVIALDVERAEVWALVAGAAPRFVAPDVMTLSDAVHQLQGCVNVAVERDHDAFIKHRIQPSDLLPFTQWADAESPLLLAPGTFWSLTLLWFAAPDGAPFCEP
jgi:hypothetical protein